jgi:hypothetical protein
MITFTLRESLEREAELLALDSISFEEIIGVAMKRMRINKFGPLYPCSVSNCRSVAPKESIQVIVSNLFLKIIR